MTIISSLLGYQGGDTWQWVFPPWTGRAALGPPVLLELSMPAEAWVALFVGLGVIVLTIVGGVFSVSGQVGKAITKVEVIGTLQAAEIKEIKASVEKLEGVVASVAVQKVELQQLRETQGQNTARNDETFRRIFAILDKHQNT